ncbi:MAG: VOC family protein [Pseudomonadales bacterium]
MTEIKGLHHAAYRCRNSESTRAFYEDFLELPLVEAFPIGTTATGRDARVLHTFYQMADGGCIAFFEAPDQPFDFVEQHDFDLHIALEVEQSTLERMLAKGRSQGMVVRGPSDHGFITSIYFRDPNGYVVELTTPVPGKKPLGASSADARHRLQEWTETAHS